MVGAERQRQLFADVAAFFIDDRQPIGIGVLGEANVGAAPFDFVGQAAFFRRTCLQMNPG